MNRCIVSRVSGNHYLSLQKRTRHQCESLCPEVALRFDRCPKWDYVQKIKAIRKAFERGHRYVLWMDVSFEPVASLEMLWGLIERDGWFAAKQGNAMLSEWTSDDALLEYGITRDEAATIPLCLSGLVGIDNESSTGRLIMNRWEQLAGTFSGAHRNEPGKRLESWGNKFSGHVSWDEKVSGHRHDESALSFVLWKLGLKIESSPLIEIDNDAGFIVGRNFQNEDGTYVR